MFVNYKIAYVFATRYPHLGTHFAKLSLGKDPTLTYARRADGHLDVWGPPEAIHGCLDDWT